MVKRFVVGLVVLSLVMVGAAQGATVSFNDNFAFPLSPGLVTLSLPQFDPGLGFLNSVTLSVDATIKADVTAENDSAIPGNMSVSLTGLVNVAETGANISTNAGIFTSTPSFPVAPSDGVPDSGPDFVDFGTISGSNSAMNTTGPLAVFIGLGTLDYDVFGSGGFAVNGVTDSTLKVSLFGAEGLVTITYDYDIIPEPSSFVLAGLGLLGGVYALRRRRRR